MADWYVKNMDDLAAWWANFTLRRPEFENKYLVLKNKSEELIAVGAWVAYWVPGKHAFDDLGRQQTKYFNTIAGNDPNADPPLPITWTIPPGQPAEVPPGIESFIREVRREIVGMTNYAEADGEAMGLEATKSTPLSPTLVKPAVQAFAAANNHHFSAVVSGREGSDMWQLWIQRKGGEWQLEGTYNGKSVDASVTLTTPGEPEQILVRVQLRQKNTDYGQVSEPVYVTLNP